MRRKPRRSGQVCKKLKIKSETNGRLWHQAYAVFAIALFLAPSYFIVSTLRMNSLPITSSSDTRFSTCLRWVTTCALLLQMMLVASAVHAQPVGVAMVGAEHSVTCEHCLPSNSGNETAFSTCSLSCSTTNCCAQPLDLSPFLLWHVQGQPSYLSYQLRLTSAELSPSTPPPK